MNREELLAAFAEPIPVGPHGFVRLVDLMGDDEAICQAARISYGKGTKSVSEDRGLIRYLVRHRHTTPIEQCEIKLHVKVPMDTWRQWIRHRTASVNEYSTRYSEAIDEMATTGPDEWRLQSGVNKQGSSGVLVEWPEGVPGVSELQNYTADDMRPVWNAPGEYLSDMEAELHSLARTTYEERLRFGVAREQARKDLPLSTYTEAYWKIDLHNLLHFLGLRLDAHAQLEIRQFAEAIGKIVAAWVPWTWEAFEDYALHAHTFSRQEMEVLRGLVQRAVDIAAIDVAVHHPDPDAQFSEREFCSPPISPSASARRSCPHWAAWRASTMPRSLLVFGLVFLLGDDCEPAPMPLTTEALLERVRAVRTVLGGST